MLRLVQKEQGHQVLANSSQLIIRNAQFLESKSVLLLNHESDFLAKELLSLTSDITTLALDYHHFLKLSSVHSSKLQSYFGHRLPIDKKFDLVVIHFPKAKSLAAYLLQLAAKHLQIGGQILVTGENKGGIKSLPKLLPEYFSQAHKLDNARHCLLYVAELIATAPQWDIEQWISQYQLSTPQGELTICNLVGVFSEKKLDSGTELLLENLNKFSGRALDFGCGAGVIAACLLKAQPDLALECVDINAMALASCELTLKANNLKAKVYPSDGLAQTTGEFQAIISNPPFHDGLDATTDIALNFVQDSYQKLSAGGQWQIVANRHLPYADTIAKNFGKVSVTAENNKYKVYSQIK